jgi:hypothetical protein
MTIPNPQDLVSTGGSSVPNAVFYIAYEPRDPGPNDILPIGKFWLNTVTHQLFFNGSVSSAGGTVTASWPQVATGSTAGFIQELTGNSGGPITPTAGNINIIGAGTTTVTGSRSTLTITSTGGSGILTWVPISDSLTHATAVSTGYIINSGSPTFTLPSGAAVGSIVELVLNNLGSTWEVNLAFNGQSINGITAGGGPLTYSNNMLSNNDNFTTVILLCVASNTWLTQTIIGSVQGQ